MPTSWQLTEELAERCNYRGQYQPLPRMAQIFEHRFGRAALIDYLRSRLDDQLYDPLPIHQIIAQLPFRYIIHAGWDRLLEKALESNHVRYSVIQEASQFQFEEEKSLVIYKLYGGLDRVDDQRPILTERQLAVFDKDQSFAERLRYLVGRYHLLMVGYALDYDAVFARIFARLHQEQKDRRPLALVMQSLDRPDDTAFWQSVDVQHLVADPVSCLYDLAQAVAVAENRSLNLPDLQTLSTARRYTREDLQRHIRLMSSVLDSIGIGEVVEQSDVPLLNREQVRNIESMRAAYERLAEGFPPAPDDAGMWLRQGNIEYTRSNYTTATQYFQRALEAKPDLAEAYCNLYYVALAEASALETAGNRSAVQEKYAAALTAYNRAITLNPALAILPAHYTIESILGQGGIGVVYRVRDTHTDQVVAIKLLKRSHQYNEKAVSRFQREAAILQRLRHPYVVNILEFDQFDGRSYIVMEYLGERSVEHLLQTQGVLPFDHALTITLQVGETLQAAHDKGIIHRDIKPSNIFWLDGQVRVIDFGLATDLLVGEASFIGQATGTLRYMAPEQQRGLPVDARSDLYALATTFYEMLSGRHPADGVYQPVSEVVSGLTADLDLLIETALQEKPSQRHKDVTSFCTQLRQIAPLQPACHQVHPWRKWVRQIQKVVTWATYDRWYVLPLFSLLVGYLIPRSLPAGMLMLICQFLGVAAWNVLLVSALTRWYVNSLARTTGNALLKAYSPLLGLSLGIGVTLAYWIPEVYKDDSLLCRPDSGIDLYGATILFFSVTAMMITAVCFTSLGSTVYLFKRKGYRAATSFWASLVLMGISLIVLAILLFYMLIGFWPFEGDARVMCLQ